MAQFFKLLGVFWFGVGLVASGVHNFLIPAGFWLQWMKADGALEEKVKRALAKTRSDDVDHEAIAILLKEVDGRSLNVGGEPLKLLDGKIQIRAVQVESRTCGIIIWTPSNHAIYPSVLEQFVPETFNILGTNVIITLIGLDYRAARCKFSFGVA